MVKLAEPCAAASDGQAAIALPINVMNSRRRMPVPSVRAGHCIGLRERFDRGQMPRAVPALQAAEAGDMAADVEGDAEAQEGDLAAAGVDHVIVLDRGPLHP